jgi:maleylpyruvate isomerase
MTTTAPTELDLLDDASRRLIRTVDALFEEEYAEPSALPGWSRGHVVAHLALNAEGMERALSGLAVNEPRAIYDSTERRDGDIAELAVAEPSELRSRLMASCECLERAMVALPEERWSDHVERTPGGPSWRASNLLGMRWREVELHHVDLDAGYDRSSWPGAFCAVLIEAMAKRPWSTGFRVLARDLARTWEIGDGDGVSVTGDAADLGYWLSGRGDGSGLTVDGGDLPEVAAW